MIDIMTEIMGYEERIEKALWSLEVPGQLEQALVVYQEIEKDLDALNVSPDQSSYSEVQRVKAYCLMRQGNVLRQQGQAQKALEIGQWELTAARASGDDLTLARSLMSTGTNSILNGDIQPGFIMVEQARSLFESGDDDDSKQGLGWYWILIADLANAGLLKDEKTDVIYAADQALEILSPLENWTGITRAYTARAQAHKDRGDSAAAAADREKQHACEARIDSAESR